MTDDTGIAALAEVINAYTGATGTELEALAYFTAVKFADTMGCPEVGDEYAAQCRALWKQHKEQVG